MKRYNIILACLLFFSSCNFKNSENLKKLPSESIFHLTSEWQNQYGETLKLKELKGKTLVVVMIYTTCKSACPILVADMKMIKEKIDKNNLKDVSLVLVSIDPETDTPERLAEFAKKGKMTESCWIFLRGNTETTQEFANVLSMKYKKISPVDFSHSNIISIFSPDGTLVSQEEGTSINTQKVADKVNETVKLNR
ncbi:MAG TPA: SCO family protein [Chitinophagales bacterium]|nr:SCO family protein [Chitinophagales bacterium]HQW78394.1 SCO family protein [Chitinophagales bacterium]HRB66837.1 SCO family protein [Chitinophagales bacterium]